MIVRLLLAAAMVTLCLPAAFAQDAKVDRYRVYIGTYTGKQSKGIYRCELDLASGKLTTPELAAEVTSPSFLAIHPNQKLVYSVNEINELGGKKGGGVSAFAIDAATGNLKLLNQQSSGGAGPCHLVVDRAGKNVLAANYGGGSVCVLPIGADGRLGERSSFIEFKGTPGANKQRQEASHAHSVNVDAENRYAFVADLGLNSIFHFRYDAVGGTLSDNTQKEKSGRIIGPIAMAPGAGPRHFAFHPDGKAAYVINELDCTITALDYDPARGVLTKTKTVTTLPGAVEKGYSTAEVVVHPSGKFVYGSNRGHNTIAIFKVDPQTHELTPAGHQGHHVKTPRNFAIEPTGTYLIVANQSGNSLVVFRIDPATGALTPTGSEVEVGSPVCVRFLPLAH
jgi:6-phosphogluconolactonase